MNRIQRTVITVLVASSIPACGGIIGAVDVPDLSDGATADGGVLSGLDGGDAATTQRSDAAGAPATDAHADGTVADGSPDDGGPPSVDAGRDATAVVDATLTSDSSSADANRIGDSSTVDAADASSCALACALGSSRCGDAGVEACEATDGGCNSWVPTTACGPHQACGIGASGASCSCTSTPCTDAGPLCQNSGSTLATCMSDSNGCLYVSPTVTTCTAPESCSISGGADAGCALTCQNACDAGATACGATTGGQGLETCQLNPSTGCLAWSAPASCASGLIGGSCYGSSPSALCCSNACTENDVQCTTVDGGSGVNTCNRQSTGCTAWQLASTCNTVQVCSPDAGASCVLNVPAREALGKVMWVAGFNLGGQPVGSAEVADTICMTATSWLPVGVSSAKALIVGAAADAGTRTACTSSNCILGGASEHVDWVLEPNQQYVQTNGTIIGTTSSLGLLNFPLKAPIWPTSNSILPATGLYSDWTTVGSNCDNWTTSDAAVEYVGGNPNALSDLAIYGGGSVCDGVDWLYCVEQ